MFLADKIPLNIDVDPYVSGLIILSDNSNNYLNCILLVVLVLRGESREIDS